MLIVFTLQRLTSALRAEGKKPAVARPILWVLRKHPLEQKALFPQLRSKKQHEFSLKQQFAGQIDHLYGLKENVIVGKVIPAGTGIKSFRDKYLG